MVHKLYHQKKSIMRQLTFILFSVAFSSLSVFVSCKKKNETPATPVVTVPKPVAEAVVQASGMYAPAYAIVTNQSQNASSYKWFVNGVEVSTAASPKLSLRNPGEYTVRLVAYNSKGEENSKVFTLAVQKHPFLVHQYTFTNSMQNEGSSTVPAVNENAVFAADRKQVASSALYFNGTNSVVRLPQSISVTYPDSLSLSVWFKVEDLTKSGVVFGYQSSIHPVMAAHYVPALYYAPNGKLYMRMWTENVFIDHFQTNGQLNNWVHVVIAANKKGQDLYVNGVKVASVAGRTTDTYMHHSYLGATYATGLWAGLTTGNNLFKGWIDDVRIYNKKLTAVEVEQLFNE